MNLSVNGEFKFAKLDVFLITNDEPAELFGKFLVPVQLAYQIVSEGNFDSVESEYSNIRCRIMDLSNHMSP